MKRSPLRRRTALRFASVKRLGTYAARRSCVKAVIQRDGGCIASRRYAAWSREHGCLPTWPPCSGPLDVHEPGKRSHGADPTDPEQCIALCRAHHEWVHAHPADAAALGLLHRSTHASALRKGGGT